MNSGRDMVTSAYESAATCAELSCNSVRWAFEQMNKVLLSLSGVFSIQFNEQPGSIPNVVCIHVCKA
jgi:hypothetical protein